MRIPPPQPDSDGAQGMRSPNRIGGPFDSHVSAVAVIAAVLMAVFLFAVFREVLGESLWFRRTAYVMVREQPIPGERSPTARGLEIKRRSFFGSFGWSGRHLVTRLRLFCDAFPSLHRA